MLKKCTKKLVLLVALSSLCFLSAEPGIEDVVSGEDLSSQVISHNELVEDSSEITVISPDEILGSVLAEEAKELLEEVERYELSKDVFAVFDGLCVVGPQFVRTRRINNAGEAIVFAEFAKAFSTILTAVCPETVSILDHQEGLANVVNSVVFLRRYADEYLALSGLGLTNQFLESSLFAGFDERVTVAKLILKQAAMDLAALQDKNWGQFDFLIKRFVSEVVKKFALIAGEDNQVAMAEINAIDDSLDTFFALSSPEEQQVLESFVKTLKEMLSQNSLFMQSVEQEKDYVYTSSSNMKADYLKFLYVKSCCEDERDVESDVEAVFSFKDSVLYTNLPVVIDDREVVEPCVTGMIKRGEDGLATHVLVPGSLIVKPLSELNVSECDVVREAEFINKFIIVFSVA